MDRRSGLSGAQVSWLQEFKKCDEGHLRKVPSYNVCIEDAQRSIFAKLWVARPMKSWNILPLADKSNCAKIHPILTPRGRGIVARFFSYDAIDHRIGAAAYKTPRSCVGY